VDTSGTGPSVSFDPKLFRFPRHHEAVEAGIASAGRQFGDLKTRLASLR